MAIDSKAALPRGDNFDAIDDVNDADMYSYWSEFGSTVYGNRAEGPVDSVNNPAGTGFMADLLEPSSDPAQLAAHYGAFISYPMLTNLTEGQQYTLSIWCKPRFLGQSVQIKINGTGNWTAGLQTAGSAGDFNHASLHVTNGSIDVLRTNITGVYNPSPSSKIGDLGIPDDIPTDKILSTKRADHIKSNSANGATSILVVDALTNASTPTDLSTTADGSLTTLLHLIKTSTLVYQEITPAAGVTSFLCDIWARNPKDVHNPDTGAITLDNTKTGQITGWAMVYTDLSNRQIIQVWRSYATIDNIWRYQSCTFTPGFAFGNIPPDTSKPVGFGFFFSGELALYGGIRIQDNCYKSSNYLSCTALSWTRKSFTFVATQPMAQTLNALAKPGFAVPLVFTPGFSTVSLTFTQPNQPKINGVNDPTYLPWAPNWASVYLYGLWINEGATPTPYEIDAPINRKFLMTTAKSTYRPHYPTLAVPDGEAATFPMAAPMKRRPKHNLGLNICGDITYSSDLQFINLAKCLQASRHRAGIDPSGIWPNYEKCGWNLRRENGVDGIGTSYSVFRSRLDLTGVVFATGHTYFTVPKATNSSWQTFGADWYDRSLLGANVPSGMTVTSVATDSGNSLLARYVVSTAFLADSDPAYPNYQIKRYLVDSFDVLALDGNGYPTTIPAGYTAFALAYRNTAVGYWAAGMLNNPYLPSGHYVLKWDGDGSCTIALPVSLSPGPFPATLLSSTLNRAVFDVDCSGNKANGDPVHIKYALGTDSPAPGWYDSRTGFAVAITVTNPSDPVRNIRLVEERYESLLDAGGIFYPEFLDRLKDYRSLRFLDWTETNIYQPFVYDINQKPNVGDVSYAGNSSHVPWEIVIELCNQTGCDCWINLHPSAPDDLQLWVARLFAENLNPALRLRVEYGNEQWNGGLGSGYWITRYAETHGIVGDPKAPNPGWSNHLKAYALLSQHAFALWESAFAGPIGLLQPATLWMEPKLQKRRLVRMCSLNPGGVSVAIDVYKFAREFCRNGYGIPYDAVCSTGYFDKMISDTEIVTKEASVAPADYPWTINEVIPIAWRALSAQTAECDAAFARLQNIPETGFPDGILGKDNDGEPLKPPYCLYEGGFGSPGPSAYMLKQIIRLKFEEDGNRTVYNLYKDQLAWWAALVASAPDGNGDSMMYNLWQSATSWARSGQWGITDKAFYPSHEYNRFPIVQAVAESAGNLSPDIEPGSPPAFTAQASRPKVLINEELVVMSNVKMKNSEGAWVTVPASVIKYKWDDGGWH